jgi:chromosome segregation ATPase
MDRDIADILERLGALRARSRELGEQRKSLLDHIDEAVAQLNKAASELADTQDRSKDLLRRPR